MKVTEATDGNKIVLYYEIRNDAGMSIGSAFANNEPFEGCEPVTLEEAKKNAHLWAAAPDLLEALEECVYLFDQLENLGEVGIQNSETYQRAKEAIKKARNV